MKRYRLFIRVLIYTCVDLCVWGGAGVGVGHVVIRINV